jgi:hypothetical protein
LQDLLDPKNFKSYNELKAKLYRVLALDEEASTPSKAVDDDGFDLSNMGNSEKSAPTPALKEAKTTSKKPAVTDDDDDDLSIFQELANG